MTANRKDITTTDDVKLLVDSFYDKVNRDELLAPIFNDIAQIDWDHHLPKMYAFWSNVLLRIPGYHGAPFPMHERHRAHLTPQQFTRWLQLFEGTVDEHFAGEIADSAKLRAANIAMVFQVRLGLLSPADFTHLN